MCQISQPLLCAPPGHATRRLSFTRPVFRLTRSVSTCHVTGVPRRFAVTVCARIHTPYVESNTRTARHRRSTRNKNNYNDYYNTFIPCSVYCVAFTRTGRFCFRSRFCSVPPVRSHPFAVCTRFAVAVPQASGRRRIVVRQINMRSNHRLW